MFVRNHNFLRLVLTHQIELTKASTGHCHQTRKSSNLRGSKIYFFCKFRQIRNLLECILQALLKCLIQLP